MASRRADRKGRTVLMSCVKTHDLSRALCLIRADKDLDEQDNKGNTALMHAVKSMNQAHLTRQVTFQRIVQELICHGADVNIQREDGATALMLAVNTDHTCLYTLIGNGAYLDTVNNRGETALIVAVKNSCFSSVNDLLTAGACLNIVDKLGKTAFLHALDIGALHIAVALLLNETDLDTRDHHGNTPLMSLLRTEGRDLDETERSKICQKIVIYGASVNAQNKDGQTALMLASKNRTCGTDILDMLLENGAKLDMRDNYGATAFSLTVDRRRWKTCSSKITWFMDKGADPCVCLNGNARSVQCRFGIWTEIGCEVMNHLIEEDEDDILKLLVCNSVFPSYFPVARKPRQDAYAVSPFVFALLSNRHDIARYLLANCFLLPTDVKDRRTQCTALAPVVDDKSLLLLEELCAEPFPLVKLAFVAVSAALGPFPGRAQRVEGTNLPNRLKQMLLFREPVSRLHPYQWELIPVNVRDYDQIHPVSRPLLFFWPFGVRRFNNWSED